MEADSTEALLATLRDSTLLDPTQMAELAEEARARGHERETIVDDLLRRGWLTPFQGEQFRSGRGRGLVLGPYVLLEPIGRGGMGQVFKARHRTMDRVVALKVIHGGRWPHQDALDRFRREIRAIARLSHPNVVQAHDAGEHDGTLYFAMEYVRGIDLAALVRMRGPLPADEACDYARQAARGLQHVFEEGLVHRDVKPSNLLRADRGGVVKLLDLGLARLDESTLDLDPGERTRSGLVLGSPDYLAPEQALDARGADIRADIYSLGCTLYHLLAGHPPFPGGMPLEKVEKHREIDPAPLGALRPHLPSGLAAVVARMMAKHPEDRYPRPADVAEALRPFARPHAPPADREAADLPPDDDPLPPPGEVPSTLLAPRSAQPRGKSRSWLAGLVVGALVLVLAVAAMIAVGRGGRTGEPGTPAPARVEAGTHRRLGSKFFGEGRFDRAFSEFDAVLRIDPHDVDSRVSRAWASYNLGKPDRALADLDEAIRQDPTNIDGLDQRGWVLLRLGRLEAALADCDRLLRLDPAHVSALRHRAQCYALMGEPEKAAADFDEAIRLDPSPKNYVARGKFRTDRREFDRAITDFDAAIDIDPGCADAYEDRGRAFAQRGDDARAATDFREARRLYAASGQAPTGPP